MNMNVVLHYNAVLEENNKVILEALYSIQSIYRSQNSDNVQHLPLYITPKCVINLPLKNNISIFSSFLFFSIPLHSDPDTL